MFVHGLQIVRYFVHRINTQFDLHSSLGVHVQCTAAFDDALLKGLNRVEISLHRHRQVVLYTEPIEHN